MAPDPNLNRLRLPLSLPPPLPSVTIYPRNQVTPEARTAYPNRILIRSIRLHIPHL